VEDLITVTVQEISQAGSGKLLAGSGAATVSKIVTDTRDSLDGCLFVALKGENFDGNEFLDAALEGGAMGVIAHPAAAESLAARLPDAARDTPVIVAVDDTGEALKRLGALMAGKSSAQVVAITGSTGKTSTKDILASLIGHQKNTVASKGSFNNEVGVPLTLLEAREDTEVTIVEMGMQAPGEISELCRIVAPDIAVITNIGPAHLEFAGSLENIAAGKAEIARGLASGGRLVAPFGESLLAPHLEELDMEIVTFGMDSAADIHLLSHEHLEDGRLRCDISCLGDEVEVTFNFSAHHHLHNAMAALGVYRLLELPLASVPAAAADISLSSLRGEQLALADGVTLINDCYNANPLSMRSSLEYLASVGTGRRTVAVLGDMGELGHAAVEYHRQVGEAASELAIDCLIAVGELAQEYIEGFLEAGNEAEVHNFPDRTAALAQVPSLIGPGDIILVKASRFMQLEQLSDAIVAAHRPAGGEV
jgi:UDP-N-acetylmuramoyl-tripeptide--D-alanyl-D-alanine ligase